MTLIASVADERNQQVAFLSDMVVTRTADTTANIAPMPLANLLSPDTCGIVQSKLTSKALLLPDDYICLFVGSIVGIRYLTRNIIENHGFWRPKHGIAPVNELMANLLDGHDPDISFIHARAVRDGSLWGCQLDSLCCNIAEIGPFAIRASGTGSELFLDPELLGAILEGPDPSVFENPLLFLLGRVGTLIVESVLNKEFFPYFRFGGWYELHSVQPDRIEPVVYSVSFGLIVGDDVALTRYIKQINWFGRKIVVDVDYSPTGPVVHFYTVISLAGVSIPVPPKDVDRIFESVFSFRDGELSLSLVQRPGNGDIAMQATGKNPFVFLDLPTSGQENWVNSLTKRPVFTDEWKAKFREEFPHLFV